MPLEPFITFMDRSAFIEGKGRPSDGCPKCGGAKHCPCKACRERGFTKPDDIVWKWIDGEAIQCGHCGWTAHADVWEDYEYEYYKSRGFFGNV